MPAAAPAPARPAWASAFGVDGFGTFADLDVEGVVQRFRWCPPGRFLMGSPKDEAGRFEWEGPQHEVRLTRGFWMADSPVTQGLYAALMGEDPSRFSDPAHPDRPVESVSWHEATALCLALEERLQRAGLADDGRVFRLPSEAEWEYACRAGTTTATYAGDLKRYGEGDASPLAAPELDPIAWTGSNCGFGDALAGGVDSGGGRQEQHAHARAGTRVVKQKAPNTWGLYDTLGNVWEWCADAWSFGEGYPLGSAGLGRIDPIEQVGLLRVCRGGSWFYGPRLARAAFRDARDPSRRFSDLGLRLSCGPAHPPPPPEALGAGEE